MWLSRTETNGTVDSRATVSRTTAHRGDGAVITLVQTNGGTGSASPLTRSSVPLDRGQSWTLLGLPGWDEIAQQVR